MLKIVLNEKKQKLETPCVLLFGGFDGFHIGHKTLLERARGFGLPIAIMTIIGGKGLSLFTEREREYLFRAQGIDVVITCDFPSIKDKTAEEFLSEIISVVNPKYAVCGEDFRFGKDALGNPQTIREMQISTLVEPLLTLDDEKVSARLVKKALEEKNLAKANQFLGEPFFMIGMVKPDRKVGRKLGFPTANIAYPKGKFPLPYGVYETEVFLDGKRYKGITNFGSRPTFDNDEVVTETYLDGFSGDLYGKELNVRFLRFLREIKKFSGAEELKDQLFSDLKKIREFIKK